MIFVISAIPVGLSVKMFVDIKKNDSSVFKNVYNYLSNYSKK